MKTVDLPVRRFNKIPGIGAKILDEVARVEQAENRDEILDLFSGSEAEQWKQVIESVNRAKRAEARSEVIESKGGSDPKSMVATCKKGIAVFKIVFPEKTAAELAQIVLVEDMRDKLAAEGVVFGDPAELKKEYDKETERLASEAQESGVSVEPDSEE